VPVQHWDCSAVDCSAWDCSAWDSSGWDCSAINTYAWVLNHNDIYSNGFICVRYVFLIGGAWFVRISTNIICLLGFTAIILLWFR